MSEKLIHFCEVADHRPVDTLLLHNFHHRLEVERFTTTYVDEVLSVCWHLGKETGASLTDDFGNVAFNNQGSGFVDADSEELRIGFLEQYHVAKTIALSEVLIDTDAGKEAEAFDTDDHGYTRIKQEPVPGRGEPGVCDGPPR